MAKKDLAFKADVVGLFVFSYLSLYGLKKFREEKTGGNLSLLLIGLGGLAVDSYMVFKNSSHN